MAASAQNIRSLSHVAFDFIIPLSSGSRRMVRLKTVWGQKAGLSGTCLAVQRVRLRAPNAGARVASLVVNLRSHVLHSVAKKNKKREKGGLFWQSPQPCGSQHPEGTAFSLKRLLFQVRPQRLCGNFPALLTHFDNQISRGLSLNVLDIFVVKLTLELLRKFTEELHWGFQGHLCFEWEHVSWGRRQKENRDACWDTYGSLSSESFTSFINFPRNLQVPSKTLASWN